MATTKLAKHLPKRCTNEKRRLTRQRSYNGTQTMKLSRMADRRQDEMTNRQRGFTGKVLDDAFRKAFGNGAYRTHKRAWQQGRLTVQTMLTGSLRATKVEIIGITWLDSAD